VLLYQERERCQHAATALHAAHSGAASHARILQEQVGAVQHEAAAALFEARESARVSVLEVAAAVAQRCEAEERRRQEEAARAQVLVSMLHEPQNPQPQTLASTPHPTPHTLHAASSTIYPELENMCRLRLGGRRSRWR
jgi:hypothetical protein